MWIQGRSSQLRPGPPAEYHSSVAPFRDFAWAALANRPRRNALASLPLRTLAPARLLGRPLAFVQALPPQLMRRFSRQHLCRSECYLLAILYRCHYQPRTAMINTELFAPRTHLSARPNSVPQYLVPPRRPLPPPCFWPTPEEVDARFGFNDQSHCEASPLDLRHRRSSE